MEKFDQFMQNFMSGDFFLIFLVLMLVILLVLVLALVKTREQYLEMLEREQEYLNQNNNRRELPKETKKIETPIVKENDILDDLDMLKATDEDDIIDENKPLIKQIDTSNIKTYESVIDEYELGEEENAVISTEELERKTKERMETLGTSDNQIAIQKYEEEQEKKAIISYEQLLKNASNITLTYKDERVDSDAPKINKIVIEEKEVTQVENYIKEEEYLKILKEFRLTLE